MNREEFTVYLNALEEKYPINEWQIEGIHIWPLIKIHLSFAFNTVTKGFQNQSDSESAFSKLKKAVKGSIELSRLFLKKNDKKPTDLFCLAPHFRFNDGKYNVNRYFNQLISDSNCNKSDFIFGEYGNTTLEYRKNIDYPNKTIYFENLKYLALLLREFSWKKYLRSTEWPEFSNFISDVNQHLGDRKLSQSEILKKFIYIKILKTFYKLFLKRYAVNETYILCYYVSEMYAMNLATADLGIDSCDIQHGGQGSLHIAYTNFNQVPQSGYKLLPKRFWTWDNASALEISKWTLNQNYHEVEVRGNPWIDYCINRYTATTDSSKKIILFTMQPVGDCLLDDYILEAIKNAPSEYEWWLRLHPRQLDQKNMLMDILSENNIADKVEIHNAVSLPLPAILGFCDVHISKFSGSILEAFILQKRTILLSKIGVDSFPDVVESKYGIVSIDENSSSLLSKISNIMNENSLSK